MQVNGADFTKCVDLQKTDFTNFSLIGANFAAVKMPGADFSNTILQGGIFKGANLAGADFSNTDLERGNFEGANLAKCTWTGAKKLVSCNFIDTRFAPVKLPDPKGSKPGAISGTVGALAATALHSVVVEIEGDSDADNNAEDDEEDEDPLEEKKEKDLIQGCKDLAEAVKVYIHFNLR